MLEEANNRLSDQIKEIKTVFAKKEDDWFDKIKDLKEELKISEAKEAESNK
jgi:hypothetical protein